MRVHVLSIAVIAAAAGVAAADDLNPPAWRGQDNSVHAEWVAAGTPGQNVLELVTFESYDLDQDDEFLYTGITATDPVIDNAGTGPSDDYTIDFPNFVDELPTKLMRIQITWSVDLFDDTPPQVTVQGFDRDPVTVIGGITKNERVADDVRYGVWDFQLFPNPDYEVINLLAQAPSTYTAPDLPVIHQVVIDTISIPAPGAAGVLTASGLLLSRRRR